MEDRTDKHIDADSLSLQACFSKGQFYLEHALRKKEEEIVRGLRRVDVSVPDKLLTQRDMSDLAGTLEEILNATLTNVVHRFMGDKLAEALKTNVIVVSEEDV